MTILKVSFLPIWPAEGERLKSCWKSRQTHLTSNKLCPSTQRIQSTLGSPLLNMNRQLPVVEENKSKLKKIWELRIQKETSYKLLERRKTQLDIVHMTGIQNDGTSQQTTLAARRKLNNAFQILSCVIKKTKILIQPNWKLNLKIRLKYFNSQNIFMSHSHKASDFLFHFNTLFRWSNTGDQ